MAVLVNIEPVPLLTVKNWTAKKGTIAKIAGETGMTKALKDLEAVYKKTPWNLVHPVEAWRLNPAKKSMQQQPTAAEMTALKEKAKASYGQLEPLRKQLYAVRDLAAALEKKWKANKLIPASSTKLVAEIGKKAEWEAVSLKSLNDNWDDAIKSAGQRDDRIKQIARNVLGEYFTALKQSSDQVKQNPTVVTYTGGFGKGFHQNIRGLSAALDKTKSPQIVAFKERTWKRYAQDEYLPKQDSEVLPKLREVMASLKELHSMVS
ncbi:hypothetical protein [Jatrophihabitans fulvus]